MTRLAEFNATDFGAIGDGAADDTASIQSCIDAAAASKLPSGAQGGVVLLPAGTFLLSGSLTVPFGVSLQGVGWNSTSNLLTSKAWGSWLWVPKEASWSPVVFPLVAGSVSANGGAIRQVGFAVFDQEDTSTPTTAAQGSAPMILVNATNVLIEDIMLLNPFNGISVIQGTATMKRIFGQPLSVGIYIDQSMDTSYVEGVHFWPFWKSNISTNPIRNFTMNNGTAIKLGRCDNPMFSNIFALGYKIGFSIEDSAISGGGTAHKVHLSNADFDSCVTGIQISGAGTSDSRAAIQMSNVTIQSPSPVGSFVPPYADGIRITGNASYALVQGSNLRISQSGKSAISVFGAYSLLQLDNVFIDSWNRSGSTWAAFTLNVSTAEAYLGLAFVTINATGGATFGSGVFHKTQQA